MKKVVKEWLERGDHDLDAARILLSRESYSDIVLFHIHQAVEKYLKGFLVSKNWQLKKIHDIETLLTEAGKSDKEFQGYHDFGRKLTAYYFEERYPPGLPASYSKKEIEKMLKEAEAIMILVREGTLNTETGTESNNNE